MANERILVVDDEQGMLKYLNKLLSENGYDISLADHGVAGLMEVGQKDFDLILLDIKMPQMDGMEFLERVKKTKPHIPIVIMTGHGTIETAIKAMKLGAYDYINKPFEIDEILIVIDKALEKKRLEDENLQLRKELEASYTFHDIVSHNEEMAQIFDVIKGLKNSNSIIFISGETGTGKELVARAIHNVNTGQDKSFVPIDCGALFETNVESELFGHAKGSFPGAIVDKKGLFEVADGGTVFFDEIGSFPYEFQGKLLRVFDDGLIKRIGDTQGKKFDLRYIVATNKDLEEEVNKGSFKKELYFRLNVIVLELPPLRDRKEDIPLLVDHFIYKYNKLERKDLQGISEDALNIMMAYNWPGNVRELENFIHHAVVVKKTQIIHPKDLPAKLGSIEIPERRNKFKRSMNFAEAKSQIVELFEQRFLVEALEKYKGNVSKVAQAVGLDRRNLQRKFKEYGIIPKDYT